MAIVRMLVLALGHSFARGGITRLRRTSCGRTQFCHVLSNIWFYCLASACLAFHITSMVWYDVHILVLPLSHHLHSKAMIKMRMLLVLALGHYFARQHHIENWTWICPVRSNAQFFFLSCFAMFGFSDSVHGMVWVGKRIKPQILCHPIFFAAQQGALEKQIPKY